MNNRIVTVFRNDEWSMIDFSQLKRGDIFRLFEPTGECVIDKFGHDEFIATTDAYIDENSGVYTISTLNLDY